MCALSTCQLISLAQRSWRKVYNGVFFNTAHQHGNMTWRYPLNPSYNVSVSGFRCRKQSLKLFIPDHFYINCPCFNFHELSEMDYLRIFKQSSHFTSGITACVKLYLCILTFHPFKQFAVLSLYTVKSVASIFLCVLFRCQGIYIYNLS